MAAPDLSVLTAAVDFFEVVNAVVAVAAAWMAVFVALRAVRIVLDAVREGEDKRVVDSFFRSDRD